MGGLTLSWRFIKVVASFILPLLIARRASGAYIATSGTSGPYSSLANVNSSTQILNCANCTKEIYLPFVFPFANARISNISATSNGVLYLQSTSSSGCCSLAPIIPGGSAIPRIALAQANLAPTIHVRSLSFKKKKEKKGCADLCKRFSPPSPPSLNIYIYLLNLKKYRLIFIPLRIICNRTSYLPFLV